MLELTVKTLDSQNHSFTLSDEATVLNLKESIFEKMEVPILSQRLIFHGKVLQDQKKLTEYGDVNGKVIHLVQRAPPSSSRPSDGSSSRRTEAGAGTGAGGRRYMRREGNATYLGSMAFPTFSGFSPDFLDSGIPGMELPSPPCQLMARNRLDCAKRMMGYARQSIRQMDDPNSQPQPSNSGRQPRRQPLSRTRTVAFTIPPTEDRGTSTNLAPPPPDGPIQDAQESLAQAAHTATAAAIAAAVSAAQAAGGGIPRVTIHDLRGANGAEGQAGVSFTTDASGSTMAEVNVNFDDQDVAVEVEIESSDVNGEGRNEPEPNIRDNSGENRPGARYEEGARVDSMVPLLADLESLNTDLQPFLARCRDLLTADNSFDDNSSPSYQEAVRVFGGVSETLHSIAHACHALSDLMVDFDEDAPRSLRCRPVVLQHSTILETGFPIRLTPQQDFEAQINVRRVDLGGNSPSGSEMSLTPPVNDPNGPADAHISVRSVETINETNPASSDMTATPPVNDTRRLVRAAAMFGAAPASARATDAANPTSGEPHGSITSVQVGRFHTIPDGLPGDLEIFMDFGLGPESGFMDGAVPDPSQPPSARAEGAASGNTTTTANGGVSTTSGLPTTGFNIANFPGATASGTFVPTPGQLNNLHSSLQAIAGQIRNQLIGSMGPDGFPTGGPAVDAAAAIASAVSARPSALSGELANMVPSGGVTSESSPAMAEGDAAAANQTGTTSSTGTASTGTTAAPEQAAAGSQTTPPRRPGVPPPAVVDMLHTLFQGSFDPALPCNSHHIRGTRQRASQTQRMRFDMFPPNATPTPPQMLFTRRSGVRVAAQGGRLVAVPPSPPPVPAPETPPRPEAARQNIRNVLFDFFNGAPLPINAVMQSRTGPDGELPSNASAADFLNNLVGTPHVEGQSIVNDLLMTLARNMTWADLVDLIGARYSVMESVLGRMRPALQEFITQRFLQGEALSQEAIKRACDRLFSEMLPYIEALQVTRMRDPIDLSTTINNYNSLRLPEVIAIIMEPGAAANFGPNLMRRLTLFIRHLIAIVMHCCVEGDEGFDNMVRNLVRLLTRGVPEAVQQWTEFQSINNLRFYATTLNVPLDDIRGYLVYRIPNAASAAAPVPMEPMETDGVWTAPVTAPAPEKTDEAASETLVVMDTENLPEVLIGSEPWHGALPSEWVPVIARDSQRQRRQSPQKPFSDAYLTGMPPKRRKLIAASKPQGESLSQTISDGVRHAIQAAGVSSPLAERAIAEAGRDPTLQQAYKDQEKASVGPAVNDDPDFKASRFPNAHKFFNK